MRIKKTVYTKTFELAESYEETALYHESNKLNVDCAAAIDKSIAESNHSPNQYNLESAARKVIDTYGEKRVSWVIAGAIAGSFSDPRFSAMNRDWAGGFQVPYDIRTRYTLNSHPCLLNGFADHVQKLCAEHQQAAALARAAKKGANAVKQSKYELIPIQKDEKGLFYSNSTPERDKEIGCIGYYRQDFGKRGDEFWGTWFDSCREIKTQAFKDEFDNVINTLRKSVLKNRSAMSEYCYSHSQSRLDDGCGEYFGFKITTADHAYYLRFNTRADDYNLYCYAYNRDMLEKAYPALAPKPTLEQRLAEGKRKAAKNSGQSEVPKNTKQEAIE